jgi:hypothetical protein
LTHEWDQVMTGVALVAAESLGMQTSGENT